MYPVPETGNMTDATGQNVTRLAPSPTGALHLGNARTFLVNYLLARRRGWRVLMRVEDLDSPRVKVDSAEEILDALRWMGLTWEGAVEFQSARHGAYQAALEHLIDIGVAYPCTCSRKDVELAASAPHRQDAVGAYPGTCRGLFTSAAEAQKQAGRPAAWRVRVREDAITVDDQFIGPREFRLSTEGGDFVIFRSQESAAYQLAVVVDDAEARVDAIVRADDLLDSAARQIHLRRLLHLTPEPTYWHLPLVIGTDGRRLAKRHGDTRLAHYRSAGASPNRVLGLLGYWSGLLQRRRETDMDELIEAFDLDRLPKEPVVFAKADDDFLMGR